MRPRVFVILLGGVAAWPLSVLAQPRGRNLVIGYLIPANPEPIFSYFKEGVQKLGSVEGRNIQIEFRSAEGKSGAGRGPRSEVDPCAIPPSHGVGAMSRAVDPTVCGAAFAMQDEAHGLAAITREADHRVAR